MIPTCVTTGRTSAFTQVPRFGTATRGETTDGVPVSNLEEMKVSKSFPRTWRGIPGQEDQRTQLSEPKETGLFGHQDVCRAEGQTCFPRSWGSSSMRSTHSRTRDEPIAAQSPWFPHVLFSTWYIKLFTVDVGLKKSKHQNGQPAHRAVFLHRG